MTLSMNHKSLLSVEKVVDTNWHWQAGLQLAIAQTQRGSRLVRNRHIGPLYVQKPFYPEGKNCAHIYLLHPPGGLVSGDTLSVDIAVHEGAHALITTPGAARLYRAREKSPVQEQTNILYVENNAILEWFPMETIVYSGAAAELETHFELGDNSAITAWEITCFGLPASGEPFNQGYFKQRYQINQYGLPVFIDNLQYDASNHAFFSAKAGMQSQAVSGFLVAGPCKQVEQEREVLTDELRLMISGNADMQAQATLTWIDDFCVIRFLGNSAYACRQIFVLLWRKLRLALLAKKACEPRIWAT